MKRQLKSKHIHYIHSVYRYCVSWLRAWRCFRLCPDWCNLKGRRTLCTQLFNLSHGFVCSIFIQQGNVVSGGVWGLLKVQTDWGPHTQTEASPSHSPSLAVICLSHLSVSLQKLAVRSCPVGTTKPLSLIKPPSQGIAISVVPAKAPVSMVTAHINGQKAVASSEPLQTSPINLQTGGRAVAAGVHPFSSSSRRAGELPPSQVTSLLRSQRAAVPAVSVPVIKVNRCPKRNYFTFSHRK